MKIRGLAALTMIATLWHTSSVERKSVEERPRSRRGINPKVGQHRPMWRSGHDGRRLKVTVRVVELRTLGETNGPPYGASAPLGFHKNKVSTACGNNREASARALVPRRQGVSRCASEGHRTRSEESLGPSAQAAPPSNNQTRRM